MSVITGVPNVKFYNLTHSKWLLALCVTFEYCYLTIQQFCLRIDKINIRQIMIEMSDNNNPSEYTLNNDLVDSTELVIPDIAKYQNI